MHKEYEVTQTDADIFDRLLTEACADRLVRERRNVNFWQRALKTASDERERKHAQERLDHATESLALGFQRETLNITSTLTACGDAGCAKHRALLVGVA